MPEVPLARDERGVALLAQHLGERALLARDADLRVGKERAVDADPIRIAPRQERRPRRAAHGLRAVVVAKGRALAREPREVRHRRGVRRRIVTRDGESGCIAPAHVVAVDDDEVRPFVGRSELRTNQGGGDKGERRNP
jgi:hypothetical protein